MEAGQEVQRPNGTSEANGPDGSDGVRAERRKEELEEAVTRLAVVQDATVELGPGGEVERLHVVARPGHSAKHVVRDVQSLLATLFRLRLDHRKISVAVAEAERAAGRRAQVVQVEHLWGQDAARASVELALLGRVARGHATDAPSPGGRLRAAVTATLRAVAELFPQERFVLEDVRSFRIAGADAVSVVLYRPSGALPEYRIGVAHVAGQPTRAAARATLNALNERLEQAEVALAPVQGRGGQGEELQEKDFPTGPCN